MTQMTQPSDPNNPSPTSDNSTNSPSSQPQPTTRRAATPLEAPLIPVPDKNFRPPPPSAGLTPKPSSAPAPRMRPSAPRTSPEDLRAQSPAEPPATAADEIAGMYAGGQAAFVSPAPHPASHHTPLHDDPLFLRKTLIPILLTLTVILAGFGALLILTGPDNALPDLFPTWMPLALFVLAIMFLILAAINIWSIKKQSPRP